MPDASRFEPTTLRSLPLVNRLMDSRPGRTASRWSGTFFLALAVGLFAVACGSSPSASNNNGDAGGTSTAPTGSLQVSIAGLPAGMSAAVDVTGPNGDVWAVPAQTTIARLAPGSYVVTVADVLSGTDRYLAAVTGSPATVVADQTAQAGVNYAKMLGAGSLVIHVAGLPPDTEASITVSGPGDRHFHVVAGIVVGDLPAGRYTIEAATVRLADRIVSPVYLGSATPAAVDLAPGEVGQVDVTYARRTGSGLLWGRGGGGLVAYASANLQNGTNVPAATISAGDNSGAFGALGGALWVEQAGDAVAFAPAHLDSSFAGPDVTIGVSFARPLFDAQGALWLFGSTTLSRLAPAQLVTSGTPTPAVVVTLPDTASGAGAFDASGNFWYGAGTALEKIPAAQLAASGTATVTTIVSLSDYGLHPSAAAFDAFGNLWVACKFEGSVAGISAALLLTGGSPFAQNWIQLNYALSSPAALAFDNSGDLWISDASSGSANALYMFSAGNLYQFLSQRQPDVRVGLGAQQPEGIAFDPPPVDLPLPQ